MLCWKAERTAPFLKGDDAKDGDLRRVGALQGKLTANTLITPAIGGASPSAFSHLHIICRVPPPPQSAMSDGFSASLGVELKWFQAP